MTKEKGITLLKRGLLAFVLVTIGFTVGKEVTLRRLVEAPSQGAIPRGEIQNLVVVSYAHATIRCVSCNTIERLIKETLDEQFAKAVGQGRVNFEEVNFQENSGFAKRYEIVANCVVLRQVIQGQELRHERLDKVWELYEDPPAFKAYVRDAINNYLESLPGDDA